MYTTEPLSHVTDELLGFLRESSPPAASGDGVHAHDNRAEEHLRDLNVATLWSVSLWLHRTLLLGDTRDELLD